MADYGVVDQIVAELIAKADGYVETFDKATAAHGRFKKSVDAMKVQTFDLGAEGQKYKAGANAIAGAEENATQRVTKARKARVDSAKATGDAEANAEKATQDRITAAVEKGIRDRETAARRSTGSRRSTGEVGDRSAAARQTEIMARTGVSAPAEVAEQKEVNNLLLEEATIKSGIRAGDKEADAIARERLLYLNLYKTGLRANLTEEDATIFAEERLLAIQKARFDQSVKQLLVQRSTGTGQTTAGKDVARFAEGAGLGRSFGSTATIAGVAAGAALGIGVEAVSAATEYAKALADVSKQAGISAESLQVYQHAAAENGVSAEQFSTALIQLSENLGRARTGSQEQAKAFAAIGVSIKGTASAGELLPTLIDRISSIKDQSVRARVELALFGETGAKLDGLLSGGNDAVNNLAEGLRATGAVLSSSDIAKLDDTSKKLAEVKAQLSVNLASIVADNKDVILELAHAFQELANDVGSAIRALDLYSKTTVTGKALSDPRGAGADLYQSINDKTIDAFNYVTGLNVGKPNVSGATPKPGPAPALGKVQSGAVNNSLLDKLGTPKPPKGPKGKSPDQTANEADQRTKRFNDLMARYQDEQLAAAAQQTTDEEERRDAQRAAIDRDSAKQIADLQTQAKIDTRKAPADARLIAARLNQAISAEKAAAQEKQNVINLESNASAIDRDVAAQNAILQFKNEQLQAQEELAKTASERRDLELQILANDQQIAANTAGGVLRKADQGVPTSRADIQAAQRTLKNQAADTASKTAVINDRTQGPLASYVDSLPGTAKEVDEAFQGAAVHGIQSFNDGLTSAVTKMLHLHGLAGQLLEDFIKIAIESGEASLFKGAGSSGGGLGGLFSKGASLFGSIFGGGASTASLAASTSSAESAIASFGKIAVPGFASGGSGVIGGRAGVDQNVLSLNGNPIAKVGAGELLSVSPNQRVNSSQAAPTIIQQTIQYSGAVDIADKEYVNQMAAAQYAATSRAIAQSGRQVLNASPARVAQKQDLGT